MTKKFQYLNEQEKWETFLDHHLFKFLPGLLRPFLDARNADFKDAGMYYYYYYYYYYYNYYNYYAVVF